MCLQVCLSVPYIVKELVCVYSDIRHLVEVVWMSLQVSNWRCLMMRVCDGVICCVHRESRPSRRHHGRSQNGAMREHLIAHKDDLKHASTRRGSRAADGAAVVDTSSRRDSKSSLRQEHSTLSSVNRRSGIDGSAVHYCLVVDVLTAGVL